MSKIIGSSGEIVLLIRRSLVRAQVEEPTNTGLLSPFLFLRITKNSSCRCHVEAFENFGTAPACLLQPVLAQSTEFI